MQTSAIKFSQIEDRIDAEYYKPEYLELEKVLENSRFLGDLLLKIDRDPNFYNIGYTKTGIPLIRGLEFQPPFLELSKVEHISAETHEQFKKTEIYPKDLVMTVRGTIGKVAIIPEELKIANISPNLIFLRPKNLFQSVFLAVVLNSKIGQSQIERIISGSVQGTITVPDIESIKIPIPSQLFQQKIEKMVKESQGKRKLAEEKYKEAEEILNGDLGLEDLDLSVQKAFEIKFSKTEDRLDPEYYQPVYKNVYKFLKQKSKPLTEICKIVRTKISPQNTPEKVFRYIEIGGVNNSTGEIEEVLNLRGWEVPSGVKYVVKNNDVLLSAVRTYLKGIALVSNNYEGDIATTGFHVLREPIIKPETLFLFLRSRLGLIQFEKFFLGSTYPVIKGYDLKNIMIPILSQSLQQKISFLIQESFKLRREAKELIEKAKKEVEEIILK